MKILYVGLGGAGQRHLRVFNSILNKVENYAWRQTKKTPTLNPDFTVDTESSLEARYNLNEVSSIDQALRLRVDLVIISTPTIYHYQLAKKFIEKGFNIVLEKPGCTTLSEAKELLRLSRKKKTKFLISFQRRFHPFIEKIQNYIVSGSLGKVININAKVSSFVPEWHPYEDFRELYACKKSLGGGVLLTECHEIDLLNYLFGESKLKSASLKQESEYDIDVFDTAYLELQFQGIKAKLDISFMRKPAERKININFQNGSLLYDLDNHRLKVIKEGKIEFNETKKMKGDELFERQAEFFLNHLKPNYDYQESLIRLMQIIGSKDLNSK